MGKNTSSAWLRDFTASLAAADMSQALAVLEARATAHAGTPSAADKRAAVKAIVESAAGEAGRLTEWASWLAERTSPTAKELVAMLSPVVYGEQPDEVRGWLLRLSDDDNWEVREWAAGALGQILDARFDEMRPLMAQWAKHPSQFVRRAVVVATMAPARRALAERCEPLFQIIEPLVTDRAEEVRRNLGPFAVGGAFLHAYPDETVARVRCWAASDDEQSRWNAAMVFSAAEAKHHVDDALDILSELAPDKRRLVWQAVSSALRNLVRRDPERAVPEIERWLDDGRKLPAALALRGVKRP